MEGARPEPAPPPMEPLHEPRRSYVAPALTDLGRLVDLAAAGSSIDPT